MGAVATVFAAVVELSSFAGGAMDLISGSPLLYTMWCGSLFFIGIGLVGALKKASRH